jgi:UDP:flavonoid glycosyltransferase YjiC (YdhE family)
MSRILLAWDLGAGFGHLGPFLMIADRLLERGHELHIAAREVASAVSAVGDLPIAVYQAPVCLNVYGGLQEPPLNYAEILMRYGYLDRAMLRGLLKGWQSLMRITQTDIVVADHAPTALMAARLEGIPVSVIGTPFSVLPETHPTPNMRDWVAVPPARLADSDRRVLDVVNAVLPEQAPRLSALHQIFSGTGKFFIGTPETDHYGARADAIYFGLAGRSSGSAVPEWPGGDGKRVLLYLHADYPHAKETVQALVSLRAKVIVHMRGASSELLQGFIAAGAVVSEEPLDLDRLLPDADLCVSHGPGTAIASLQAGVPVLILPKQLENFLFARSLERMGVGALVNPDQKPPDIHGALAAVLSSGKHTAAARAFAERHRGTSVDTIAKQVVARIEALAGLHCKEKT